jgi:hypothetical protein
MYLVCFLRKKMEFVVVPCVACQKKEGRPVYMEGLVSNPEGLVSICKDPPSAEKARTKKKAKRFLIY